MKACASKRNSNHYRRYQRYMCPPPMLPTHHRHHLKSNTMSLNGTTLRVCINGAWITWIYLFAIFIRLESVDAKIALGERAVCNNIIDFINCEEDNKNGRLTDTDQQTNTVRDALAHSMRRNSESHRLDVLRNITDLLGRTFSSQFVFPVLGHEDGQGSNFKHLGELWRHWLPLEALQTFEKGGYYTIEQTKSRLRIIALNTNFMRHDVKYTQSHSAPIRQRTGSMSDLNEHNNYRYHHGNHYRSNGINGYSVSNIDEHGGTVSALSGGESHESQKQWDWFEDVLAKSSRNKETVYIVGHIPPGSDERQMGAQPNSHTNFSEKNNLRYLQLVRKYSSIILGQFFGHLHSDSFRIIYNDNVSWIMIAPSVTPKKQSIGSNNPAMRLYKFDTDIGQVLDYTQYCLDLKSANTLGEAVWQPEYNLTTHYFGSGEVTAVALHNLADRFSNTENPLFAKYCRANSVRYPVSSCEGVCALNHYCAITRVDYHEFRIWLETAASALA